MQIKLDFCKPDDPSKWTQTNLADQEAREIAPENRWRDQIAYPIYRCEPNSGFFQLCVASIVQARPAPSFSNEGNKTVLGLQGISQSDVEL